MLFLNAVPNMSFSQVFQDRHKLFKIGETVHSLTHIFHDIQSMLFETIRFVNIRLIFEWKKLESLRSYGENVLEKDNADVLQSDLDNFGPRILGELDGLSHVVVWIHFKDYFFG